MAPAHPYPPIAITAEQLSCSRGGHYVFSGLSLRVAASEFLAVTGPNGSGKSTLLRALAGLLRPESGVLRFEGGEADAAYVHYLGHADALKSALTLLETLRFWALLYRGGNGDPAAAADAVGLGHALRLPVGVLSAGQRRRAGLARLLVAPRPVWLLDEPAAALDRKGAAILGGLMRDQLARGGLIVAATHQELPVAPDRTLDLGTVA